jgi:prepilin-type N-terminal cleavage/methylation domain-containing protein
MRINRERRRGGFTLIEMLVVVVIIALLASLLVGGAWKVMTRAREAAVVQEIRQFDTAITNFQNSFNVPYIPSRIWLDERGEFTANSTVALKSATALNAAQQAALEADSRQYLERVFGRNLTFPIDWNGDGTAGNSNVILEGHQCLAFFLGGITETIPDPNDGGRVKPMRYRGFSTNPTNPANFNTGGTKGPFLDAGEFTLPRFFFSAANASQNPNGNGSMLQYPGLLDRYGSQPYVYFSSYKGRNGYNRYGVSDCESLGMRPYYEQGATTAAGSPDGRYIKPDGYQIISAGRNMAFGSLTNYLALPPNSTWPQPWSLQTAGAVWPSGSAGADDLSNFHDTGLGSGQ